MNQHFDICLNHYKTKINVKFHRQTLISYLFDKFGRNYTYQLTYNMASINYTLVLPLPHFQLKWGLVWTDYYLSKNVFAHLLQPIYYKFLYKNISPKDDKRAGTTIYNFSTPSAWNWKKWISKDSVWVNYCPLRH